MAPFVAAYTIMVLFATLACSLVVLMIAEPGFMCGAAAFARRSWREDVGSEGALHLIVVDAVQPLVHSLSRGIVDEHVDASQLGDRAFDNARAMIPVTNVSRKQETTPPAFSTQVLVSSASTCSSGR